MSIKNAVKQSSIAAGYAVALPVAFLSFLAIGSIFSSLNRLTRK